MKRRNYPYLFHSSPGCLLRERNGSAASSAAPPCIAGAPVRLPPAGRQVLFQRLSGAPLFCSLPQPAQGGAGPPAQARLAAHPRARPRCPLRAGRRRPLLGAERGRPLGIGCGAPSGQRPAAPGQEMEMEEPATRFLRIPQGYTCLL